jgi:hypothetical protein
MARRVSFRDLRSIGIPHLHTCIVFWISFRISRTILVPFASHNLSAAFIDISFSWASSMFTQVSSMKVRLVTCETSVAELVRSLRHRLHRHQDPGLRTASQLPVVQRSCRGTRRSYLFLSTNRRSRESTESRGEYRLHQNDRGDDQSHPHCKVCQSALLSKGIHSAGWRTRDLFVLGLGACTLSKDLWEIDDGGDKHNAVAKAVSLSDMVRWRIAPAPLVWTVFRSP